MNPFKLFLISLIWLFSTLIISVLSVGAIKSYSLSLFLFTIGLIFLVLTILFQIVNYLKYHQYFRVFLIFFSLPFFFFSYHHFSQYGYEGGHDPGVYFQTAISISRSHSFTLSDSSFLPISYPGITVSHQHLTDIFPPAYPLYLSFFYCLFGLPGIALAVVFLEFLAYQLLLEVAIRLKIRGYYPFFPALLFLINYYTLVFFRSTYIENFVTVIYLFIIYCLLRSSPKNYYYYFGLIAVSLLSLSRSEGPLNFFLYLLLAFPLRQRASLIIPIIVPGLLGLFHYHFFYFDYFLQNFIGIFKNFFADSSTASNLTYTSSYNKYLFNLVYVFYSFAPVGYIFIFILDLFGLLKISRYFQKKFLTLFFGFSLQFSYFFNAEIAFYLPWFVRRLYPGIVILSLIVFSVVISQKIFNRYLTYFVFSLVLVLNLISLTKIINFQETGPLEFLEKLDSFNLPKTSLLVFADRFGIENYAPTAYFLHQYSTYYDRIPFDNPETYSCLAGQYLRQPVYLLTTSLKPDTGLRYFDSLLTADNLVGSFQFVNHYLSSSCDVRNMVMNNYLFQGYQDIASGCQFNNPPTDIKTSLQTVYIYEIYFPESMANAVSSCSLPQAQTLINNEAQVEYASYTN